MEQVACKLLVEDTNFCPFINLLHEEAKVTNQAGHQVSLHTLDKHHRKNLVWARLFQPDQSLLFCRDTVALFIPLDMRSHVILEAHDSMLGRMRQEAEKTAPANASKFHALNLAQFLQAWVWGFDIQHHVMYSNHLVYGVLQLLPIPETPTSWVVNHFFPKLAAMGRDTFEWKITTDDLPTKRVRRNVAMANDLMAETFAKELIDMSVQNRGNPDDLISYRDMCCMWVFWKSLTVNLGVKHLHTTSYHPQTDGRPDSLNIVIKLHFIMYVAQCLKVKDCLQPLAEFTYNAPSHKSLKTSLCPAANWFIPSMLIDLLLPNPRAASKLEIIPEQDEFVEQLPSDLNMVRERLEEAQTRMTLESNKFCHLCNVKVGDSVVQDTRMLLIEYGNLTKSELADLNCTSFQQPYCRPFCITETIGANAFRLNTRAHCTMRNGVVISWLKWDRVDHGWEDPSPPTFHSITDKMPEYDAASVLKHHGTLVETLQHMVKLLGYSKPDWQLLANLKGGCRDLLQHYHYKQCLLVYRWMLES